MSNAIYISDMFLDGGVIVSTVDRDGYKETQRASKGVITNKPIVVLINKGSDINKKGITPDLVVELTEENVKNKDDVQLKRAIEVMQNIIGGKAVANQ